MKKYKRQEIEDIYLELTSPINFRSNFRSKIHFIKWLLYTPIDELEDLYNCFVKAEMYDDCKTINDVIIKLKIKKLMK